MQLSQLLTNIIYHLKLFSTNDNLDVKLALKSDSDHTHSYIPIAQKGVADGVASLDGAAKLTLSQLPLSAMEYQGHWNPNTNIPALVDGNSGYNNGDCFLVKPNTGVNEVTINLGSGDFLVKRDEWLIYSASGVWERSGATIDVWINNVKMTTWTIAQTIGNYDRMLVGRRILTDQIGVPYHRYFVGEAKEITIWNSSLSDEEIAAIITSY